MTSRRYRLIAGCMGLVLTTAIAACSSSKSTSGGSVSTSNARTSTSVSAASTSAAAAPSGSAGATGGTSSSPAKTLHLTVAVGGVAFTRVPLYLAFQQGYFKQQNLDVTIQQIGSGADATKLVASGGAQILVDVMSDVLNANSHGEHLQVIGSLDNVMSNYIVASTASKVKVPADLAGATIAVPSIGSGGWEFAVYVAQLAGVSKDKLKFVPLKSGSNLIAGVKAGRVDAGAYSNPSALELVQQGLARYVVDTSKESTLTQLGLDSGFSSNMYATTANYAQSNADAVQRFSNGIQMALNWMNAHSVAEIQSAISGFKGFDQFTPSVFTGSLTQLKSVNGAIPSTTQVTKALFDGTNKIPLTIGSIKAAPSFDTTVNNTFADAAAKNFPPKP